MKQQSITTIILLALLSMAGRQARAQAQGQPVKLTGTVTYVTSSNVYVRFENTEPLQPNDTLYTADMENYRPCLLLIQKSSVSSIGKPIGGCSLAKGDEVVYFYTPPATTADTLPVAADSSGNTRDTVSTPEKQPRHKPSGLTQKPLLGRVTLANYTTTGKGGVNSRSLARLMLRADHIGGSKFSFYHYGHFRYSTVNETKRNWTEARLNIYELYARYEPDSSLRLTLGRVINPNLFSVGPMDGLQAEKYWHRFYAGLAAGTRPDPVTFGLNPNLLQYGAWAGLRYGNKENNRTNLGFIEQKNRGVVDRRYLFMQHQSRFGPNLSLFASGELDLYRKDTLNHISTTPRPTSLYVSLHYRPTDRLSLMASYDMRKNYILYESFSDQLSTLTVDDPLRSGLRLRATYRISNNLSAGISLRNRLQSDKQNYYSGASLFLNLYQVPGIGGRWFNTLNTNINTYYRYYSFMSRYAIDLAQDRLSLSPYARGILYDYIKFDVKPVFQVYGGLEAYYRAAGKWDIGILYEYSDFEGTGFHRFDVQLTKRF